MATEAEKECSLVPNARIGWARSILFLSLLVVAGLVSAWYAWRIHERVLHPNPTATDLERVRSIVDRSFGKQVIVDQVLFIDSDAPAWVAKVEVPASIEKITHSSPKIVKVRDTSDLVVFEGDERTVAFEAESGKVLCYEAPSRGALLEFRREFLKSASYR